MTALESTAAIRQTLVEALEFGEAGSGVAAHRMSEFAAGEGDIALRELGLDSLARMEMLIALETSHSVVVPPGVMAEMQSLNDLVAWVSRQSPATNALPRQIETDSPEPSDADGTSIEAPFVVRWFQRAARGCHSVARLNRMLNLLEHRLSPLEFEALQDWQRRAGLLSAALPAPHHAAVQDWLYGMDALVASAGKARMEPFHRRRIAPAVLHFVGPGNRADKTLLIGFTVKKSRRLMIPHAGLLQHLDAQQYDLLVMADPWGTSFRQGGVPLLGRDENAVIDWLATLGWLGEYRDLRCFGCSAGSYPAVLAAYRLKAQAGISIAGRFPSERHLATIIAMLARTGLAASRSPETRALFCYSVAKSRDQAYARRMGWLTGGSALGIDGPSRDGGHLLLVPLLERGELGDFLQRSVLAPLTDSLLAGPRRRETRHYGTAVGISPD